MVSDGRAWAVLRTPRTGPVDAAVLHEVLLPAWGVAEEQIGYHHSLDQALHTTARQPGIVVAVHPPTVAEVMATAAARRADATQVDVVRSQAAHGRGDARPARTPDLRRAASASSSARALTGAGAACAEHLHLAAGCRPSPGAVETPA